MLSVLLISGVSCGFKYAFVERHG